MEVLISGMLGMLISFAVLLTIYYVFFWSKNIYFHSSWDVLIDDFSFSSQEFYKLLKKELASKGIRDVRFEHVRLKEGNIFSSRRLYLRVHWKDFHFDICAAPFGKGFFLSWWLVYKYTFLEWVIILIPFIGRWLYKKLFTITYYRIDTGTMFMKYTHLCVLTILDEFTISDGVRILEEDERKPILSDIFSR